MIQRVAQALVLVTGAVMGTIAAAQTFPSRPITIVVGYSAGGQADILARKIGQQLGENLKTSVVVENRTGGNTLIASQSVARSAPDGHTIILVTDGMTTIDPLVPGGNGFDPLKAFDLVINLATAPLFLAAKKDLPVSSLVELIEYGKQNPTALNFGTSGPTTPHRIAGEMMKQLGGFQMAHVAYRGTAASVNDLAGGHISLVIGAASALAPMASDGKIKILAVTSEKRFPLLPDVPPVSETFPGFNVQSFLGLAVNKGTPEPLVTLLNSELNKVLENPEVREFLAKQGMNVGGGTVATFNAQVARDRKARGEIIRDTRAWSQDGTASALAIETRTLDELHRAALAEGGELLIYGGGDLPNGSAGTERAFNARFPGMKIRILVDRSKYHHVRIDNQLALGKLACDAAHILSINAYDRWKADGRLLAYKPAGWNQILPDLTDPDAAYVAFTVFAFSTVFNTSQITDEEAPRDALDYLNPKFKDRIALSYPHDDDAVLYQFDRIVSEYGWSYLDRLLAQNIAWYRGSAPARLAVEKGDKAVSFTVSGPLATPANATSKFVLPRNDSFLSWPQPFAIFKDARHPAAAKLYLNWLLSKEVQDRSRQWPVRRDATVSGGYGPITQYRSYPAQFRAFLRDRVRLEKVRDQFEQYMGPMQGPNPTKVEGIFPADR